MSIFTWCRTQIFLRNKEVIPTFWNRSIITGSPALCEIEKVEEEVKSDYRKRETHPLEICLKYMESEAYKKTYGDKPVWFYYVRNFRGNLPPDTRMSCIKGGYIVTASPCPICRDEYLLPHYQNVKLLKQFISPYGEHILPTKKSGVCQVQQFKLKVAIEKAYDYGLISFTVPFRSYDYSRYIKKQR